MDLTFLQDAVLVPLPAVLVKPPECHLWESREAGACCQAVHAVSRSPQGRLLKQADVGLHPRSSSRTSLAHLPELRRLMRNPLLSQFFAPACWHQGRGFWKGSTTPSSPLHALAVPHPCISRHRTQCLGFRKSGELDGGGENVPHRHKGSVRPAIKVPDPTRGTDAGCLFLYCSRLVFSPHFPLPSASLVRDALGNYTCEV